MSDLDELVARATRAAREAGAGDEVTAARPLVGGHSGLTVAADLVAAGAEPVPIVLKAAPPGRAGVGRHDVLRQARLFRALAGFDGVRVPRVYFDDPQDPPFFAMDLVDGEVIEPILDESGAVLAPDVLEARARGSAEMLAALHAGDPEQAGLGSPVPIRDELARWARTMTAVDESLVPGHDVLLAALERTMPQPQRASVVHGDYRLGNIVCRGRELSAVIDWEIWTVGDPRLDLGWYLVHFDPSEYPGIGPEQVPGLPSAATVLAWYEDAAGQPVDDWPWFDAFGRYKLAAIMAHNLRRHREKRHHDPFQERLPPTIALQIERGRAALCV